MAYKNSTYQDEINQAIVRLLEIFPEAELTTVAEAVTCAASLSGEKAYNILVEQAVAIYLESVERDTNSSLNQMQTLEGNAASSSQFHSDVEQTGSSSSSHGDEIPCTPSKSVSLTTEHVASKSTNDPMLLHPGHSSESLPPSTQQSSPEVDKSCIEPNSLISSIDRNKYTNDTGKELPRELDDCSSNLNENKHGLFTGVDRKNSLQDYEDILPFEVNTNFLQSKDMILKEDISDQNMLSRQENLNNLHQTLPTMSHGISESASSSMDDRITPVQKTQLKSSLKHLAKSSKSSVSTNKPETCSDVQANITSTINPSPSSSTSKTQTGSGETSMDLEISRTTSETLTSNIGKRSYVRADSESPPCVPRKKANLETKSLEMSIDDEWPVLVPCKTFSTPRKKVQTGLSPNNSSEKKSNFIDLTDDMDVTDSVCSSPNTDRKPAAVDMDVTDSVCSFPNTDRKPAAGKLQQELILRLNDPGPSVAQTVTTADSNSVLTHSSSLQSAPKSSLSPRPITSDHSSFSASTGFPHPLTALPPGCSALLLRNPATPDQCLFSHLSGSPQTTEFSGKYNVTKSPLTSSISSKNIVALVQKPGPSSSTGSVTQSSVAVLQIGVSPLSAVQQLSANDPGTVQLLRVNSHSQGTASPQRFHAQGAVPQLMVATPNIGSQQVRAIAPVGTQQLKVLFPGLAQQARSSTPETAQQMRGPTPGAAQQIMSITPGTAEQIRTLTPGIAQQARSSTSRAVQQMRALTSGTAQQIMSLTLETTQQILSLTPGTAQQIMSITPGRAEQIRALTPGTVQQARSSTSGAVQQMRAITSRTAQEIRALTQGTAQQARSSTSEAAQQMGVITPGTAQQIISLTQGTAQQARSSTSGAAQQMRTLTPGTAQQIISPTPIKAQQIRALTLGTTHQIRPLTPGTEQQIGAHTPETAQQKMAPTRGTAKKKRAPTPGAVAPKIRALTAGTPQQLWAPTQQTPQQLRAPTQQTPQQLRAPTQQTPQQLRAPTQQTPQQLRAPTQQTPQQLRAPTQQTPQQLRAPTQQTPQQPRAPTQQTPQQLRAPTQQTSKQLRATPSNAVLLPPESFEGGSLQDLSSEAVIQQITSYYAPFLPDKSQSTAESSHTSTPGSSHEQSTSTPVALKQFNRNAAHLLNTLSYEVDAQSHKSPGSFQSEKGTHPKEVKSANSSSCETIGILEMSSLPGANISKRDQGGTKPYDTIQTVQGLLDLPSTDIANQESRQNEVPMPDISVGQIMPGNFFGSRHLKSIANNCYGKISQTSSAQSLNAVMSTMNKLFLMTESNSLQQVQAKSTSIAWPVQQPSTSNSKGLFNTLTFVKDKSASEFASMEVDSIASSSSILSKSVKKEDGANGYRNYRLTNNMDTDEDITRTDTRLMLKTTDDVEADRSAFSHGSDILECSACSTSSAVHKCVSCSAGHFICKSCVEEEIQSVMLSKQRMGLLCTSKSCQEQLLLTSLELIVDAFVLGLLRKNIQQKEMEASSNVIKNMEGLVSCPSCQYSGLMENEQHEFVCANNNCTVRCCRYCKSKWTNKDDHLGCYLLSSVGTECFNDITVLPLIWEKTDMSGNDFQVKMEPTSPEGLGWNEYFKKTNPRMRIVALWRIQNRRLWERYVVKRKHMVEELGLENIQEKALFHGTKFNNIKVICSEGFDFRVQAANGSALGRGIYFSKTSAYSQKFACAKKHMFIARVLCGQSTCGNQSLTRPPHNPSGRMFDSCVDNLASPTMYTVFDNSQCYPEILLQFN